MSRVENTRIGRETLIQLTMMLISKKRRLHVKLELEFYSGSITVYQSIPFSLYEISLFTSYAPGP